MEQRALLQGQKFKTNTGTNHSNIVESSDEQGENSKVKKTPLLLNPEQMVAFVRNDNLD